MIVTSQQQYGNDSITSTVKQERRNGKFELRYGKNEDKMAPGQSIRTLQ
jgi:hypothetical protein